MYLEYSIHEALSIEISPARPVREGKEDQFMVRDILINFAGPDGKPLKTIISVIGRPGLSFETLPVLL